MYSTLAILMVSILGLSSEGYAKYQSTYVTDDNKLFSKYESNYDPRTRITTKIKRKKVLKKVKKIKKSSTINSSKTKKVLTYIPEKAFEQNKTELRESTV